MTDSHAHLDACAEPDAVVARAQAAGVTRIVTIGTGIDSCRRALEIAESHEGVAAALGIDPHRAATAEAARVGELRALLAHRKAVAVGETGLDGHHGAETLREQRVLLDEHLALAESLGLPVVIHSRAASAATAAALEPFRGTVILHCFSEPELLEPALERGYYVSFAGNVTYPSAAELRASAAHVPADRILVETDTPVPRAAARPRPAQRADERPPHAGRARRRPRGRARGARSTDRRERDRGVRARRRVTRVAPKKALGQHFLVDRNVLGVIERLARLRPEDVVLEIGPGLGVLTTFLADRVAHVHAVELDRSLDAPLREALAERRNVELVFGDALALDLAALDPAPDKLVSNLPYNIATPLVVESLTTIPTVASWCVMVQREVADRFFAEPGTKAYGAVSVLVRLNARRTGFHRGRPDGIPTGAERRLGARRLRAGSGPAACRPSSRASSRAASRIGGRRSRTRLH